MFLRPGLPLASSSNNQFQDKSQTAEDSGLQFLTITAKSQIFGQAPVRVVAVSQVRNLKLLLECSGEKLIYFNLKDGGYFYKTS